MGPTSRSPAERDRVRRGDAACGRATVGGLASHTRGHRGRDLPSGQRFSYQATVVEPAAPASIADGPAPPVDQGFPAFRITASPRFASSDRVGRGRAVRRLRCRPRDWGFERARYPNSAGNCRAPGISGTHRCRSAVWTSIVGAGKSASTKLPTGTARCEPFSSQYTVEPHVGQK